jgi:hypothetical protein
MEKRPFTSFFSFHASSLKESCLRNDASLSESLSYPMDNDQIIMQWYLARYISYLRKTLHPFSEDLQHSHIQR